MNELIAAGPFVANVARTFSLDEAAEAHRALGDHDLGKYALRVSTGTAEPGGAGHPPRTP
jgi:hypothetical protein